MPPDDAHRVAGIAKQLRTIGNWCFRAADYLETFMGRLTDAWGKLKTQHAADLASRDAIIAQQKQAIASLQSAQLDTADQATEAEIIAMAAPASTSAPTITPAGSVTTFNIPMPGGAK